MNTVCLPLFLNDHNIFGVGIPVALQYILTGDFFRALTVLSIGETILSGSEKDIKRLKFSNVRQCHLLTMIWQTITIFHIILSTWLLPAVMGTIT